MRNPFGWLRGSGLALGVLISTCGWAQTTLELDVVTEGMTVPWDLVWGPDNHIWCLEKTGRISRIHPDTKEVESIYDIPDVYQSWDNSGAHSMILHPDFPRTPYIYVNYTYEEFSSRLSRLTYSLQERAVVDTAILVTKFQGNTSHNGSRMLEGPDGYLYMSMGDAYLALNAQNESLMAGKVLRMDWDGKPAPGNPFGNRVYSMGHRNPQGLVFADDGKLYLSEHGAANNDEINLIREGKNYGWPYVEGFCDQPNETEWCESLEVVEPLAAWTPTMAPCGLEYFDHPSIPEWQHSLLLVFLKRQHLRVLHLDNAGEAVVAQDSLFYEELGRLRDVLVAPNGRVFISTSNQEINGWNYLALEEDDRILEIVNPDWNYEELYAPSDLQEVFLAQLAETPQEEGTVFPQPANFVVSMYLSPDVEWTDVTLFDMSGRAVKGYRERALVHEGLMHLWVGDVQSGLYVLEVVTDAGDRHAQQVLVQHP